MAVQNVVFDMVDRCNLVCPSCYHGIHGGTKKRMSIETCRTVLDHCVKYFAPKSIWPFNWGEPFMCEDLGAFIRLFAEYPQMSLSLSSNMNREVPDDLIELVLTHVDTLTLSVSALDQSIYQRYHKGGKIDAVMRNIDRFIAVRDRIGSKATLAWSFGKNRHNASQEPLIRKFCEDNRIALGAIRYYVTDAQDVFKILKGIPVKEQIYAPFYDSLGDVKSEIENNLTPGVCALLTNDIVVDTEGYLMLCCATKVATKVHVTEVTTIEDLSRVRLDNAFCKTCFDVGVVGYFGNVRSEVN